MIQSIIFKKRYWNIDRAVDWLHNHGFKVLEVDITPNYYRFRQQNPSRFRGQKRYRIKWVKPTIGFVMAFK